MRGHGFVAYRVRTLGDQNRWDDAAIGQVLPMREEVQCCERLLMPLQHLLDALVRLIVGQHPPTCCNQQKRSVKFKES